MTEEEFYGSKDLTEEHLFWLYLGRSLEKFKRYYNLKNTTVHVKLEDYDKAMNIITITCVDNEEKGSTEFIPYYMHDGFTLDFKIDL